MLEFAKLSNEERRPYFDEAAMRRGIGQLVVEKDFWVCFTLRLLFEIPEFKDRLVFKGGTSLSKVFGIIKRFSEDIDISLDPEWLGFGGDKLPDRASNRSQFDKRWKRLIKACSAAVNEMIQPRLEEAIQKVLGSPANMQTFLTFEIDEQTKSPILIFQYPTLETNLSGYISPYVKLEMGSLTDQQPTGQHTINTWVSEEFPDVFKESDCFVIALEAERTFWEKATILHAEYHRPRDVVMKSRIARDCYDLFMIASHECGRNAMSNTRLLECVVEHKRIYFRSLWANYDMAKPGTLRLVPPEYRISALKADYQQMQVMFTEEPPLFDALLSGLRKIEDKINR